MKKRSKDRNLRQPGDSKAMIAAIDWIEEHDLPVYRPTDHCYYVEGVKLWPDTGTIQIDDRPREKEKGLAGFESVLLREGILRNDLSSSLLPPPVYRGRQR